MTNRSKGKKRLLVAMVIFLSFFGSYQVIGQGEVEDEEDLEEVFDEAVNESAEGGIEDFEDEEIEQDNNNEEVQKVLVEDRGSFGGVINIITRKGSESQKKRNQEIRFRNWITQSF